jgi:hypothetical protein
MFFFEKKNQKTFARLLPCWSPVLFCFSADRLNIRFLVLFFKKEHASFLLRCPLSLLILPNSGRVRARCGRATSLIVPPGGLYV